MGRRYRSVVSRPRSAAALLVGVFVAVIAVVVGATAASGWRSHHAGAPAAAANVRIQPAADPASDLRDDADSLETAPDSMVSQIPDTSIAAGDDALRTRPGTLVAQGDQFRIEKVALTAPVTVTVKGAAITADSVFRITITAGPYEMRDMPAVVSLDNSPLAMGIESVDLASLTAFTFDASVVTNGATLSVSYGLPNPTSTVWSAPVEVIQ